MPDDAAILPPMSSFVLRIACPDRPGLIHGVTGVLFRRGFNIVSNDEFVQPESGRFFMRSAFEAGSCDAAEVKCEIAAILPGEPLVSLEEARPRRLVVLATREYHCVGDLLVRHDAGELPGTIAAVVSNRRDLRPLVERFSLPFLHVPHDGLDREAHDGKLLEAIAPFDPDYLVLARYMRVLTPGFVNRYPERVLNIHHSFLPAFTGAQPYHQAYRRGVKIIGATAHFVTETLDGGPIICQSVIGVDHAHGPEGMAQAGRDVEKVVLARALRLVLEGRVFVDENRTVVFG